MMSTSNTMGDCDRMILCTCTYASTHIASDADNLLQQSNGHIKQHLFRKPKFFSDIAVKRL